MSTLTFDEIVYCIACGALASILLLAAVIF